MVTFHLDFINTNIIFMKHPSKLCLAWKAWRWTNGLPEKASIKAKLTGCNCWRAETNNLHIQVHIIAIVSDPERQNGLGSKHTMNYSEKCSRQKKNVSVAKSFPDIPDPVIESSEWQFCLLLVHQQGHLITDFLSRRMIVFTISYCVSLLYTLNNILLLVSNYIYIFY